MPDKDKIFLTLWELQQAEIEAYCFGSCKKVIFGILLDDLLGQMSFCFENNCPFLEKETSEPIGEIDGKDAYVRKLKSIEDNNK